MIKKKLALSRDWLLDPTNIYSNKLPMHPLAYWAQSPEVWKDLSNLDGTKNLLVHVLRISNLGIEKFTPILESARQAYNLFFLSICLDSCSNYTKNNIIKLLQPCLENTDLLGEFLEMTNPVTFYESLNNQAQLQAVFCKTIKLLPTYDEISEKLFREY